MFCVQETETTATMKDPYSEKDPLDSSQPSDSDDEPEAKRSRMSYSNPGINLQVYQIPAFNIPKSLSIFPTNSSSALPKFVNNPLNLANPLTITTNGNGNFNPKRYSLPAKLPYPMPATPKTLNNPLQKVIFDSGGSIVRYKKNGEVAKKRGPPKGYKRKPKVDAHAQMLQSITNGVLQQAQNLILSGLLGAAALPHGALPHGALPPGALPPEAFPPGALPRPAPRPGAPSAAPPPHLPSRLTIVPRIKLPPGVELVELSLDPADWFPAEPYRMSFSRKKNPKWKTFPHRCEHCFKGYRVVSTLLQHAGERHGAVPKELAVPCPCCPHVSTRRKQHKKHLESHEGRRHRIFCLYCLPPVDPAEPYVKESERYPWDKFPQYWYASEESLRLHKRRKHPYSGLFSVTWHGAWGDQPPNS